MCFPFCQGCPVFLLLAVCLPVSLIRLLCLPILQITGTPD